MNSVICSGERAAASRTVPLDDLFEYVSKRFNGWLGVLVSELCLKSFTSKVMAPETWVEYFWLEEE